MEGARHGVEGYGGGGKQAGKRLETEKRGVHELNVIAVIPPDAPAHRT